ncbi:MAG: hypothetical protein PHF99_11650, partial [Bacteroidales bacterium]|nr:hypothetical protein [Bacteroidales bacterium]
MKKFSFLTILIIIAILYSCGGTKTDESSKENDKQEQKQEKKQENDKASEKLSKSTKEGMMML